MSKKQNPHRGSSFDEFFDEFLREERMNKRIRAAKKQVIEEARWIHRNGYGNGTTFGLGEAFRELDEAEQEKREVDRKARRKTKKRRGSGGIGRRAGPKNQ